MGLPCRKTAASRDFHRLFGSQQLVLLKFLRHQLSSDATSNQGFFSLSLSSSSAHRSVTGVYCVCDLVWLFQLHSHNSIIERGSQRERDRERAQARSGGKSKQPKNDGLTPEQRRQRDAKALQEKAAKKAAQAGGVSGGTNDMGCRLGFR
ncbi:hypothetical protein Pyn_01335 [Prunus yedoensis var. nudiflora]|uniref:Small EDRK-rich factor-like N-terminal domain-containing protein n=1 Tax=Prunus yedoensis var. nudiflora TaxID=2094558 RepID=A0A315A1R6_PRUYE|nr:hypothetical protein Pyn_01335 [Prunus yedoensis var. nudiflora]